MQSNEVSGKDSVRFEVPSNDFFLLVMAYGKQALEERDTGHFSGFHIR